VLNPEKIWHH